MHTFQQKRESSTIAAVLLGICLLGGCSGSSSMASGSGTPPPPPNNPPPPSQTSCSVPAATIVHGSSTVNTQQTVFLDPAKYPQALCNDGTPAAYVYRAGVGAAASRWIISLEGGDECGDQPTCSARAANNPQLISSAPYQANPSSVSLLGGLLSSNATVNPDFYDATQVHALYCSSDDWSGAKGGSGGFSTDDVASWNFQGRAILAAIVADITANHSFAGATEVLFTGDSAGGVGVFANVNDVAKLVPGSARFVASSDAAFGNTVYNFSPNGTAPDYDDPTATPAEIAKRLPAIVLWNGHGDTACAAAAATPTEQVACYSAQQLLGAGGTIALPMFVSEAQQDLAQLSTDGIPQAALSSANFTTAESGYVSYFAGQMRSGLAGVNAGVSVFSPDALLHVEQNDNSLFDTTYTFSAGSTTLQQSTGAWYKNPCSAQRNIAN